MGLFRRNRGPVRTTEPEARAYLPAAALDAVLAAYSHGDGAGAAQAAATETAAGLVARAFASAAVDGPANLVAALTPHALATMGRSLIRDGESIWLLEVSTAAGVTLTAASDAYIVGPPDPAAWIYRLTLDGPNQTATVVRPAQSVVHVSLAADPARPWQGIAPLSAARAAARLHAATSHTLGNEAAMPHGGFLPVPHEQDSRGGGVEELRGQVGRMAGRIAVVETMAGGWDGGERAPARDWEVRRFGADPPDALVQLHQAGFDQALAACGVSPALFGTSTAAAARESYRQFLHALVEPLGHLAAAELSAKLDAEISLSFEALGAGDIASRARAFQSLVNGGMDVERAAALSGLLRADDD